MKKRKSFVLTAAEIANQLDIMLFLLEGCYRVWNKLTCSSHPNQPVIIEYQRGCLEKFFFLSCVPRCVRTYLITCCIIRKLKLGETKSSFCGTMCKIYTNTQGRRGMMVLMILVLVIVDQLLINMFKKWKRRRRVWWKNYKSWPTNRL